MTKEEVRIYNPVLGLDGTMKELLDWAYRYDSDYSDEALEEIANVAKNLGFTKEHWAVPLLVKAQREREKRTEFSLPYESMKLDKLHGFKISHSETDPNLGEIEVWEEDDKVLISISAMRDGEPVTAAGAFSIEEFMSGDKDWLDQMVGQVWYYGQN